MGRISALTELTSLASDDYLVVLDSSANIAKKITIANAFGIPDFGWTATGETHTYSSWSSTTRIGVITVPTDATTKYTAGMRYRISQSTGGTKYGIITKVTATTLTVFFPEGTTLNNETITSPHYATVKIPIGFNADPTIWTLELTSSSNRTISSASYASLTDNLVVGIGSWKVSLKGNIARPYSASTSNDFYNVTLSSDTSTETYPNLTFAYNIRFGSASASSGGNATTQTDDDVLLAAQTTLTVLGQKVAGVNGTLAGGNIPTIIRAVCNYL